ncbi:MAG: hypothetical protein MPK01_05720, partial [Gammaproteobacteria bacterium]|nr:hypothetical protein [Gammaproteobacteria bacterium]
FFLRRVFFFLPAFFLARFFFEAFFFEVFFFFEAFLLEAFLRRVDFLATFFLVAFFLVALRRTALRAVFLRLVEVDFFFFAMMNYLSVVGKIRDERKLRLRTEPTARGKNGTGQFWLQTRVGVWGKSR